MSRSIGKATSPMNSHRSEAVTGEEPSVGDVRAPIRPTKASALTRGCVGSAAIAFSALRGATSQTPSPVAKVIANATRSAFAWPAKACQEMCARGAGTLPFRQIRKEKVCLLMVPKAQHALGDNVEVHL